MGPPGSCNTDSLLGNHPNKILIIKPSITFNTQDSPIEWVIFPTITINITYRYITLHLFKWYIEIDW